MSRSRPCRLLVALLLVGPARHLAAQVPRGAIAGEVRDQATGAGIEDARIELPAARRPSATGPGGRFLIPDLAPGRYLLRIAALGYAPDTATVTVAAGDTARLVVSVRAAAAALPGIVVTASRKPERVEDAPASVAVLSQDEIIKRNVNTLEGALPFVPGVTFNGPGQMDIRGSTASAGGVGSRVLTLIDGHPALSGDGSEIIFEALPLLDIDQVEVVKGAASALYGSNALGGVMNLVTTPIDSAPASVVRAHYGVYQIPPQYRFTDQSLSAQGLMLQHSRRIGAVGARLALARETSDGFQQNGQYSRWFLRAKASSLPNARHPWDGYAIWSRNDAGDFLAWRSAAEPFEVQAGALGDRSVYDFLLSGATVTPIARPTTQLRLSPYVNYNSNQNYFTDNQDYHRATRIGTAAELYLLPGTRHELLLGTDDAYTLVSSNFLGTPRIVDAAVFAQDEIELGRTLKLSLGARLDHHSSNESESELAFNPKAALVYRRSSRLSFRTSLARGYRAPSAIEQFVSSTQFGFRVVPNPSLHGEYAWSAELGVAAQPVAGMRVDATLFQSDYHDLISPAAAPGQFFVFQFQNVTRARVRGLDLGLRADIVRNVLGVQASYLYLDSEDLFTHLALPYRSRHNVTGTVTLLRGLVGLDVRWRSRIEQVLAFPLDPRGDITVVDLRLAYRALGTVFQAKVGNLFQAVYPDVQERVPGAPRSVMLTAFLAF
ncbi:MAG TPA: TonB-dependent receptor [Gemmatimonadales bacterium]|nr:TonB-dependent receptor [Gemmatimonadales bacterium]